MHVQIVSPYHTIPYHTAWLCRRTVKAPVAAAQPLYIIHVLGLDRDLNLDLDLDHDLDNQQSMLQSLFV